MIVNYQLPAQVSGKKNMNFSIFRRDSEFRASEFGVGLLLKC